jgi:hypothetical protein
MGYIGLKENTLTVTKEPLAGDNLTNLLRLLAQNRLKISFRYLPRVFYSILLSSIIAPFRIKERIKFDKAIEKTKIKHPPIFLLGHWRSGTTYLHNVLSQDENLGFFSTFHAYAPGIFLGSEKTFMPILVASLPKKRPMDDVDMGPELPQEDEYAMGAFSPYSYYHGWCFPKNMEFYNRFVLMENVSKKTIEDWKKTYLYLLKKVTLYRNGRRLILKNPANTARVKLLLEMFPDARFINIYRNPYHLYFSMMRFMRIVIPLYCVQKPPKIDEIEKIMMDLYSKMYKKYFREKKLIPQGNLVEIRYEDFIKQPLDEIKRIYNELGLKGFKKSEKAFKKYIASQANIKTHKYEVDEETAKKINKKWGFIVKEFGYKLL